MAGMCGNGQARVRALTVAAHGRILSACARVRPEMALPHTGMAQPPDSPDTLRFSSTDVDDARSLLSRLYQPVGLDVPDGGEGFSLDARVIQLGPLTVGHLRFGGRTAVVVSESDGYYVILTTAGRLLARYAGHDVTGDPSVAVVVGPGRPVRARHDAGSAEVAVKIARPALEAELSALLGRPVSGPIELPPAMDLRDGPGKSWARLVRLMEGEIEQRAGLMYQPLIAEQLRRGVLSGLLLAVPHRYTAELTAPAVAGPPTAIRRVVDAIHDEPERPFSVAELAGIAGVSVRSLQEGFRRHVGAAPMAYLHEVRLERAHETLRRADPTRVTVASVAHRWGFAHLGRFASAYRVRYGAAPSRTLRDPH
jgi:AraC-like DNA-binding protein